jgi:hypothetical protein
VILEARGQHEFGNRMRAALGQEEETVLAHRCVERRATRLPVRKKLGERARIHDRARQDVRADLGTFFEHAHAELHVALGRELFEAYRGREACRARADDHHVVLHRLAFGQRALLYPMNANYSLRV